MCTYTGIGVMSGTSEDGIDLCLSEFTGDICTDIWAYRILKATTIPYSEEWKARIHNAANLSGYDTIKLNIDYGHLLGQTVKEFIDKIDREPDFVASHGHTVFHQPQERVTFQMGDGETMSTYLHVPLITNFRNKDVALGGQGAPIVPYGERKLFSENDICINFGGIINISFDGVGFDVCPCNMVLNYLTKVKNPDIEYDADGKMARSGRLLEDVLDRLNKLEYYSGAPPKSLSREWVEENMMPILDIKKYSSVDLLHTFTIHIAEQVAETIAKHKIQNKSDFYLLMTGGGAFNKYLIEVLQKKFKEKNLDIDINETDDDTINYKEALIMAFLGMHCMLGLPNICRSVTGASTDSVSGSVHLPPTMSDAFINRKKEYDFMFLNEASPRRSESFHSRHSFNSQLSKSDSMHGSCGSLQTFY